MSSPSRPPSISPSSTSGSETDDDAYDKTPFRYYSRSFCKINDGVYYETRSIRSHHSKSAKGEKQKKGGMSPEIPSIAEFDEIISDDFSDYFYLSNTIGGVVAEQSQLVDEAVKTQRTLLALAAKSQRPSDADLVALLKPNADKISEIRNFREKNQCSEYFNHLSTIAESVPALGWVAVRTSPAPFIREKKRTGEFYGQRVLKDFKTRVHAMWVKAWINFLNELQAFVKRGHGAGLAWNPQGDYPKIVNTSASTGPVHAGPPLPPPSLQALATDEQKGVSLFEELSRGGEVTKGLRKVTPEMQTHKNPELRKKTPIKPPEPKKIPRAAQPKQEVSLPPKFKLEGNMWAVEHQQNKHELDIPSTEVKQSVYMFKCENSTLKVSGKVNTITMDNCKKCAILFDSVVSSFGLINCRSAQMQVLGKVPTITVEKTDGCQMFLSPESLSVMIVTSKSSEMNVLIPKGDEIIEQPIPEQFVTTILGTKLKTTPTELA